VVDCLAPDEYLARTRRARTVLYLDFDGVLQSDQVYVHPKRGIFIDQQKAPGRTLFEWVHLLEAAIAPFPDVRIVLSTSWARRPGFSKARARLPVSVQERVIGATFHRRVHGFNEYALDSFIRTPRALQILADVRRRQPVDWLAVDDDTRGWPDEARHNLVACDSASGLSCPQTYASLVAGLARLQALA
jgi:hypothetical protein